jgi:hypothetical protein
MVGGIRTPQAASYLSNVGREMITYMRGIKSRVEQPRKCPVSKHTCWDSKGVPIATAFFAWITDTDQVSTPKRGHLS